MAEVMATLRQEGEELKAAAARLADVRREHEDSAREAQSATKIARDAADQVSAAVHSTKGCERVKRCIVPLEKRLIVSDCEGL